MLSLFRFFSKQFDIHYTKAQLSKSLSLSQVFSWFLLSFCSLFFGCEYALIWCSSLRSLSSFSTKQFCSPTFWQHKLSQHGFFYKHTYKPLFSFLFLCFSLLHPFSPSISLSHPAIHSISWGHPSFLELSNPTLNESKVSKIKKMRIVYWFEWSSLKIQRFFFYEGFVLLSLLWSSLSIVLSPLWTFLQHPKCNGKCQSWDQAQQAEGPSCI